MAAYNNVLITADPISRGPTSVTSTLVLVGAADSTAPVITVVAPSAGSVLPRTSSVTFDVTDETGLEDVIVWVDIAGTWEVVYGSLTDGFAPSYSSSTRSVISNGYRYQVQRTGGWSGSPTFHARAFDTGGNTA